VWNLDNAPEQIFESHVLIRLILGGSGRASWLLRHVWPLRNEGSYMSVKSQCANSLIGKCSGRVNLGKEDILIALRAHLDSSGKLENDYMTLAAVAASDQIWQKFEADWDKILSNHTPKATYVHMRELAHQHGGFDRKLGWNDENAFGLSNQCLIYMNSLDKKRFKVFYCAIDLKAWRKLQAKKLSTA